MAKRRRWTAISAAAIRCKLLDSIFCGASRHCRRRRKDRLPENLKPKPIRNLVSDRLSDLLKLEISDSNSSSSDEAGSESETRRKVEALEEMKIVVRDLQCGGERRREAAMKLRRMAKDDGEVREMMAMLGAIPPLIGMIDDADDDGSPIEALYALLNLGIGNHVNKSAIVKAGAVHKMLYLINSKPPPSMSEAIVANFLSLTALDSNKPIIGSSNSIQFLVKSFKFPTSSQSQQDSLRALFNLSISSSNIPLLIGADLVPLLLSSIGDMESSDRVLSILSNIVSTFQGRRAVTQSTNAIPILIDVLNWIDSPKCQEKAAYILMVIAHKSDLDRNLLIKHGIKSALLELVLVGSNLSQKRASRILEILRVDKGKQVSEGFFLGLPAMSAPVGEVGVSEESRAVRELVNESLECNLKRIVKRANLIKEFGPSDHFKGGFTFNATSKSLPF